MKNAHDVVATLLSQDHDGLDRMRKLVAESEGRGDGDAVKALESETRKARASNIRFDDKGRATITGIGKTFDAGLFRVRSVGELRGELPVRANQGKRNVKLFAVDEKTALTDIGSLQAFAGPGTLFQVASQFNCLEAPEPDIVPIGDYFHDNTQGPRASISAYPGTFARHYAAPGPRGHHFIQCQNKQLDLLAGALPAKLGRVQNGYLAEDGIRDLEGTARALADNFDHIRVGVHDGIEVALGFDQTGSVPPGQRIAQVFTSTFARGLYSSTGTSTAHDSICRSLLRAAYLGTLLAAVTLAKRQVVLTMIGGGVFENPPRLIWESLCWAVDEADRRTTRPLIVLVNGFGTGIPRAEDCKVRGGKMLRLA